MAPWRLRHPCSAVPIVRGLVILHQFTNGTGDVTEGTLTRLLAGANGHLLPVIDAFASLFSGIEKSLGH